MANEPQTGYPVPPIAEAIIELRFDSSFEELHPKLMDRLKARYPDDTIQHNFSIHVDVDTVTATVTQNAVRHRMSNEDGSELFLLGANSIAIAQLPIYQGWDSFISRLKRDWKVAKSVIGFRKIVRIGLRYTNKLDFPFEDDLVEPEKYLNLFINTPPETGVMRQSSLTTAHEVAKLEAAMVIQSATIESLLPKHLGMLLDIDIGRASNVPQKDEAIFDYLEQARHFKNEVFEACITDVTRKTFYNDLRIGS